jgi:MATE family multidrug resistance protein
LAKVNLGGLWGVGVLWGFIFTFVVKVGVVGLWYGLALGVFSAAVLLLWSVSRLDWELEAVAVGAGHCLPSYRFLQV